MPTENETVNRGYDLPYKANKPSFDVDRLVAAITAIDVDVAQLFTLLALKAALESPAFSGSPTAPTQPVGSNNNTLATTGHVQAALAAFLNDADGAIATITALTAELSEAGVVSDLMALIALKAPLASPGLTGTPTAPTAAPGTNTTQLATTAFVEAMKAAIVSSAPTSLNTLAKFAAAIGDDPNFVTTVTSVLSGKAPLDNPAFTGNPTVPMQAPGNNTTRVSNTAFVKNAIDTALSTVSGWISSVASALVPNSRTVSAGAGLNGGGDLSANRSLSLGSAKAITNSTTGTIDNTGHDHPLGFLAAEVYTGNDAGELNFAVGERICVYVGGHRARNTIIPPCLHKSDGRSYVILGSASAGSPLAGVWRSRGPSDSSGNFYEIVRTL